LFVSVLSILILKNKKSNQLGVNQYSLNCAVLFLLFVGALWIKSEMAGGRGGKLAVPGNTANTTDWCLIL